jgi:uncharacterized phage protein (TIGR01671 family)
MREILFKAKRIDNGEWVEGYYAERNGKTFIGIDISIYGDIFEVFCTPVIRWFEVDPKTFCQFTGLCDKNGKKIWESDIISYQRDNDDCPFGTAYCGKLEYVGYCELADCLDYDVILMTEEHYDCESKSRPEWCPLKPLPEKKSISFQLTM